MIKHLPLVRGCIIRPAMGICLLFYLQASAQNAHVNIQSGTYLNVSSGNLVLNNADVQTTGQLNAGNALLSFTGNAATGIGGTSIPVIKNFSLNKAGAKVTLLGDVKVSSLVDLQNGVIDLNGKTLTLSEGAFLQGENETNRITGITGGKVTVTKTAVSNPALLNIGNLGAAVTTAKNLGNITVSRMHKPAVNPGDASNKGIQRTYYIQPQNNTALNATLRFYYLDAELNGNVENQLSLWQSNDGITWNNSGTVTRNTASNYVEKTGLATYSYFTLSDDAHALPISLISFRAICQAKSALIQWQSGMEINAGYFEVQRSADAVNWLTIETVKAVGAANGSAYSYNDVNPQATAFYRLKMVDKSGSFSYSNVFSGGCADIAMPFSVYPNPAVSQATARISVRQATKASVQIFSIKGQQLANLNWQLQTGINQLVLPVTTLAAGTYIVKVLVNGSILQTTLIKQ